MDFFGLILKTCTENFKTWETSHVFTWCKRTEGVEPVDSSLESHPPSHWRVAASTEIQFDDMRAKCADAVIECVGDRWHDPGLESVQAFQRVDEPLAAQFPASAFQALGKGLDRRIGSNLPRDMLPG
jgi:hypothetical protein